jgi:hypothetical protein
MTFLKISNYLDELEDEEEFAGLEEDEYDSENEDEEMEYNEEY